MVLVIGHPSHWGMEEQGRTIKPVICLRLLQRKVLKEKVVLFRSEISLYIYAQQVFFRLGSHGSILHILVGISSIATVDVAHQLLMTVASKLFPCVSSSC